MLSLFDHCNNRIIHIQINDTVNLNYNLFDYLEIYYNTMQGFVL